LRSRAASTAYRPTSASDTQALRWARTWVALAPADPQAQRLLAMLERGVRR